MTGALPVPLMAVRKEVFDPDDEDNIECTGFLEEIAAVAAKAWIKELLDPKKIRTRRIVGKMLQRR